MATPEEHRSRKPGLASWLSEVGGGTAAAALVLPQAMAFGVALFGPVGVPAATGALVGLLSAAALSTISGLFGGTRGLVSAPTGPGLVLLSGMLATFTQAGLSGDSLLSGLAVTVVLTGMFQLALGAIGGGKVISFMPLPVVAGFMTGSALLMLRSQWFSLLPDPALGEALRWVPAAIALFTFAAIALGPRLVPRVPGPILGLVAGTAAFHAVTLFAKGAPAEWLVGKVPGVTELKLGASVSALEQLPLPLIVSSALALALLTSLDTLLTSVIADVATGARHDARRELIGQGLGQALGGLMGGIGGAGTTGATLVAIRSGGRRWAGSLAGLVIALLLVVGGKVGLILPRAVLAGVIVHVAISMIERDIYAWAKRARTRPDALIAIAVTAVTVAWDLMIAVAVGVAIALSLFLKRQVQAPVIHRHLTGKDRRSTKRRPVAARELLEAHGERIVIAELRGSLFFGTTNRLLDELAADLDRPVWLILHLRRVRDADLTAVRLLAQMASRLRVAGGELLFCNVHKEIGIGRKVKKTLRKSTLSEAPEVKTFIGSDEALEYAEDRLLEELGQPSTAPETPVSLRAVELLERFSEADLSAFEAVLEEHILEADQHLFERGDHGDSLFIVREGEVDLVIPTTARHHKRVAKCGPGMWFGDVALLDAGPRSATAIARRLTVVWELTQAALAQLRKEAPGAALALLEAVARTQAHYVRWSAAEIERLAQW